MTWNNAVTTTKNGCTISLHVIPNSEQPQFPGPYNPWRNTIDITITANLHHNQGNQEIIITLAHFFSLNTQNITIIKGQKNRNKTIQLTTITKEKILQRLKDAYHEL
ncbi:MAG: DUF167 domain-containing protein [Candidatus Thermoplasmatota archaeon]|nr:DUF167 domain-containing protein [Candidatus Thermoplasmatota archaeon]MBU1940824.1 DUF167 domain-containing protein [Candidatus Thermoplasmatota archaeon]